VATHDVRVVSSSVFGVAEHEVKIVSSGVFLLNKFEP